MAKEIWKPVPGHVGVYSVSNMGNVRSESRTLTSMVNGKPVTRTLQARVMRQHYVSTGATVTLSSGTVVVRRLVALAFLPKPPARYTQVRNIDGDVTNNAVSNIEWCEPWKNLEGAGKGAARGENAAHAKLTANKVKRIFERYYSSGTTVSDLARAYKVSPAAVRDIVNGNSWGHVTGLDNTQA